MRLLRIGSIVAYSHAFPDRKKGELMAVVGADTQEIMVALGLSLPDDSE